MFNILLVDDEELALTTLRYALPYKEYGITDIHCTTSSLDALELLQKQRFDACFVDIRMPGMNGLDLIEAAQQYNSETVFVIVSGYSDFSYAKKALQFGVLDYCLKPIAPEDCIPVLEKLSNCIVASRLKHDPLYISKLLTEETFCKKFLSRLVLKSAECKELTLLLVRSNNLFTALKQLDTLFPAKVLFLAKDAAILIWTEFLDSVRFDFLSKDYLPDVLLIYSTTTPSIESFQSAFKILQTQYHSQGSNKVGIIKTPTVHEETSAYFSNILSFIETNYASHLTLQDIAFKFAINYSYLSQLFTKILKKSFAEYLTNIRLTHACELLSNTDTRITTIAESVGFNDYHYFCNLFKRYYSMTPMQYRNTSRKEADS